MPKLPLAGLFCDCCQTLVNANERVAAEAPGDCWEANAGTLLQSKRRSLRLDYDSTAAARLTYVTCYDWIN